MFVISLYEKVARPGNCLNKRRLMGFIIGAVTLGLVTERNKLSKPANWQITIAFGFARKKKKMKCSLSGFNFVKYIDRSSSNLNSMFFL